MRVSTAITGLAVAAAGVGPAAAEGWEFTVAPYIWGAGVEGDIGTVPGFPSVPVDLAFSDILDDLVYGGFLSAAARNGPWAILFDASTVKTNSTESVNGPVVRDVRVESTTSNAVLGVGYELFAGPTYSFEGALAARWWQVKNDYTVRGAGGGSVNRDNEETWFDPLIGAVYRNRLSERWLLLATANVGGFGVGSDLTWGASATLEYAFNETVGLAFGYRYLSVDYDGGSFEYDVTQGGPLLGLSFRF